MDELNTNARALLERAKPRFAPSSEELERVRRRLSSEPPPPPPKAANGTWYAGVLVIAGLLAGVAAIGSGSRGAAVVDPGPTRVSPIVASTPMLGDLVKDSVPFLAPSASAVLPMSPAPTRASPRRALKSPTTDTFAAELKLIMAARKALEARAFTTAREAARRYLHRFEDGSFGEEAQVLRLLASCGIERTDAVKTRARAYAQGHDRAFARRVRVACLDDSD